MSLSEREAWNPLDVRKAGSAVQTGKSMAQLPISDARTASVKTLLENSGRPWFLPLFAEV